MQSGLIVWFILIKLIKCQQVGRCDGQLKALHRAFTGRNLTLVFEPAHFTGTASVEWMQRYTQQWYTLERRDTRYSFTSDKNVFMMTINKVGSFNNGSIFMARLSIGNKICDSNFLTLSVEENPCGSVLINSQRTMLPIVEDTVVYINYTPSNFILQNRETFTTTWVQDPTGDGRQTKMIENSTMLYTVSQAPDDRMSVIIQGMQAELNGHYGVRCFDVVNKTETFTNTEPVIIPDKPTLGAFCFDGQRNSQFACEEMFAIQNLNKTVFCNITAGTHPSNVDVLLDGKYIQTSVNPNIRHAYEASIRITDSNPPSHEVTCTANYSGYSHGFSVVKKLQVIVPVEKPEMLITELKDQSINITCSSTGRPTPNLSILIGKDVERDLIQTFQYDSSREMNKFIISKNVIPSKWLPNNVTCCSQQTVTSVGYQKNVCSDARMVNFEYAPEITFDNANVLVLGTNETMNVTCTVNSNPQSNILWKTDDNVLNKCDKTSLCLLSVNGSAIKEEGYVNKTFRCHAENKVGKNARDLSVSLIGHTKKESTSDRNENTKGLSLIVWLGGGIGAVVIIVTVIIVVLLCRKKRSGQNEQSSARSNDGDAPTDTLNSSAPVYTEVSKVKKMNAKTSATERKMSEAPVYSEVSKVKKTNEEPSAADRKEDQLVYVELDKTALSQDLATTKHELPNEPTEYVDINFAKTEELAKNAKGESGLKNVDSDDNTYMNSGEVESSA